MIIDFSLILKSIPYVLSGLPYTLGISLLSFMVGNVFAIILAFMNILPIPALDGGHVLFLIYEIIARRKPSDKFMERAQMVGMFLLFGLLIWANFNDILRYFF